MNYELFRHNFNMLRAIPWSSENRAGDNVMFELMDTAAAIAEEGVRLPEMKRGIRTRILKLKDLPEGIGAHMSQEFWSDYVEVVKTCIPTHHQSNLFAIYVNERGDAHWISRGY